MFPSHDHRGEGNATLDGFKKDADALGTPLHDFMKRISLNTEINNIGYILVDSTKTEDKTAARAMAEGDRLFAVEVEPKFVKNWRIVSEQLTEALILFPHERLARLYTRDKVTTARLDKTGKISALEEATNEFNKLQVVKVDSTSMIGDLAEVNKGLFNLDSLMREELHKQTFTQYLPIVTGKQD